MMRREEQLLTRAILLEEVRNYKFVPQTNLVEVQMGGYGAKWMSHMNCR
jgi:two-component system, OmpR family, response regulator